MNRLFAALFPTPTSRPLAPGHSRGPKHARVEQHPYLPLSVMSDSRTSTNGHRRSNAGPCRYFGCNDSFDRREVALAQRVVLLAIKAFSPSIGLSGVAPVVHDTPADEPRYMLLSIPPVKQQAITAVRAVLSPVARNTIRTVVDSLIMLSSIASAHQVSCRPALRAWRRRPNGGDARSCP
jgi:hypothetical protein